MAKAGVNRSAVGISPVKRSQKQSGKTNRISKSKSSPQKKRINTTVPPTRDSSSVLSDGIIPSWTSLPFEILVEVFRYASAPAHGSPFRAVTAVNWLLSTARLCSAFAEAALTVLYETPPLLALDQPHQLLQLLQQDQSNHFLNYRTKVKRLELNSDHVLAYTAPGWGLFELADVLQYLPTLAGIDITNSRNRPPYRRYTTRGKWHYSNTLISSLQTNGIRLSSWRWHGDMLSERIPPPEDLHGTPVWNGLKQLTLSNLDLLPKDVPGKKKPKVVLGAEALEKLESLTVLILETCTSKTWDILEHLPTKINHLTVLNCPDFGTEHLQAFFVRHGHSLKELVLNHNHSLDLTFLPTLESACPRLDILEIDLSYYGNTTLGSFTHQSNAEPTYDALLGPEDIPRWPSTLQRLQILHLRKLTSETATAFFESLIAAAPRLLVLRSLVIKAILNISWRDRAGFREHWISKLTSTFLRQSRPPDPALASQKTFRTSRDAAQENAGCARGRSVVTNLASREGSGPCDIVDISIDNMRPSELRFTEDDFMDPEESGDEEYQD